MTILITIHALVTVALIAVVLMQKRSTGALGGLAGQSNPSRMATPRARSNPLAKLTTWLATVFIGLSLLLAYLSKSEHTDPTEALSRAVSATSVPVETTPVLPRPGSTTPGSAAPSSTSAPISPLKPDVETPQAPSSSPASQEKTAPNAESKPSSPQPTAP
jgi:preprotein translocase subunit SecG